jgi:Leucine-rich repeat (LRR) protein
MQLSEGLEHLTGLAELALCGHQLPVLCLPWAKLKGLTRLTAEVNQTTSIDAGISCLTALQELSVQVRIA